MFCAVCVKMDKVDCTDKKLQSRILKILEEAFELTWFLCDSHYQEFCGSTLIHVMAQIIPTGFVLNTAYWPLYESPSPCCNKCICVCSIYDIRCPHKEKNNGHFLHLRDRINLVHLIKTDADRFKLTDANFQIEPLKYKNEDAFKVRLSFISENLRIRERNAHMMAFRLTIHDAVMKHHWKIQLRPNPSLLKYYGKIIPSIIPVDQFVPMILKSTSEESPFTIVLEKPTLRMHDKINIDY